MYAFIEGKVCEKAGSTLVLLAGGVGYQLNCSLATLNAAPVTGETMRCYTWLSVREDAMELFGFADQNELTCFKQLTAISGVGPKVGISILSELTPERVALAVAAGDYKALTKAAGFIRRELGRKIDLRYVPEILFELDTNIEYAAKIDRILKEREGNGEAGDN